MDFYNLDTKFGFGKFKGKTLKEVVESQASYIDWCAINVDRFYISDEVLDEVKSNFSFFTISEEAKKKLFEKYEKYSNEQERFDERDIEEREDYERDNFDALTDGNYGDYDDWTSDAGYRQSDWLD
jgi:hypothetical protein